MVFDGFEDYGTIWVKLYETAFPMVNVNPFGLWGIVKLLNVPRFRLPDVIQGVLGVIGRLWFGPATTIGGADTTNQGPFLGR